MRWLALWIGLWTADAAVIKGVLVDNYTGRPLARTLCVLTPLQGTREATLSLRTGAAGQFTFSNLAPGAYLLTCTHRGFAPLRHGQKNWNAPAAPIVVGSDDAPFLTLRMRRYGGITGTIQDENEIGFADVDVYAYKANRPSRHVAKTRTDDRGNFRLGGLEPGTYLVRTGAQQLEDGTGLLPSFHREAVTPEEARPVDVILEEDTRFVSVRPAYGKLLRLRGQVYAGGGPVQVTLTSPLGSVTTLADSQGNFSFDQLPPGPYEVLAVLRTGTATLADWRELYLDRDNDNAGLTLARTAQAQATIVGTEGQPAAPTLLLRRKELDGEGIELRWPGGKGYQELLPGKWEARAVTEPSNYPASIQIIGPPRRGDAWSEFRANKSSLVRLQVVISGKPAAVSGKAARAANDPAGGAVVFLETWDPDTGRRIGELRKQTTDSAGAFRFEGLPPGTYRLLATFEFVDPDEREMANGRLIRLTEGEAMVQDLDLFVIP